MCTEFIITQRIIVVIYIYTSRILLYDYIVLTHYNFLNSVLNIIIIESVDSIRKPSRLINSLLWGVYLH